MGESERSIGSGDGEGKRSRRKTRSSAPTPEGLLTVADVAADLQVGESTVYLLDIPVVRIGRARRYLREDVEQYKATRRVPRRSDAGAP